MGHLFLNTMQLESVGSAGHTVGASVQLSEFAPQHLGFEVGRVTRGRAFRRFEGFIQRRGKAVFDGRVEGLQVVPDDLVQRAPLGLSAAIDGALRAARCLVVRHLRHRKVCSFALEGLGTYVGAVR